MQGLDAMVASGAKVALPQGSRINKNEERALAADMRLTSEFVDNVMATGTTEAMKPVVTQAMIDAATINALPGDYQVDTGTMHPANMVGSFHAWKIKSSYPIPGRMINDDYRRRFLAMYAAQQEKALEPSRRQRELQAEVAVAVTERFEEHRLPNAVENLLGQIEGVLEEKDRAVEQAGRRSRVYEGTPEQVAFFGLLKQRKVREVEDMFLRGEVNVAVVEPGTDATGLLRAVSLGLLTIVRLFCKGGADCDYTTPRGVSAVHCAWDAWLKVKVGHPLKKTKYLITRDILQLLLEFGADVNKASGTGLTPLHMAATFGHDDIVAMLLRFGADRMRRDKQGRMPLDIARTNQHHGCAGLLANWGTIEKHMRMEEFRKEWGSALESRIAVERRFLGRDKGGAAAQDAGALAKATTTVAAFVDDPNKAGAVALLQARDTMMRVAGPKGSSPTKSAQELIDALRLQEHLRERRKAAEAEDRATNPLYDATTALQVAEYDLTTDALRAIDPAADARAVGDEETATRLKLAASVVQHKTLPWGRGPAIKEEPEHVIEDTDELSRAIAEEEEAELKAQMEADTAANVRAGARDRARAGGAGMDHDEGLAVRAIDADPSGSGKNFDHLVRQDSTRNITKQLYDQPSVRSGAGGDGGDAFRTPLKATAVPGQDNDTSPTRTLLEASMTSRNLFATAAAAGIKGSPPKNSPPKGKRGGKVANGERDDNGSDGDNDAKPVRAGPPADTAAMQAMLEAQTKKQARRQWENEMKKKERDRDRAEAAAVQAIKEQKEFAAGIGGLNGVGFRVSPARGGRGLQGSPSPGRPQSRADALNLGRGLVNTAFVDEEDMAAASASAAEAADAAFIAEFDDKPKAKGQGQGGASAGSSAIIEGMVDETPRGEEEDPAAAERRKNMDLEERKRRGSVDSDGVPIAERLKDVLGHEDDDEIAHMSVAELKEYRWRKKMLQYYGGMKKVAATDGKQVDKRRKNVAKALTNDAPEIINEYTRTYGEAVVTRKPAVASSLLRPSRFRVDTRTTVDAETVVAKGKAFETLMASAVTTEKDLKEALGIANSSKLAKAIPDPEDKPGPPRPGMDAMSLSQHAQASIHDPVLVAEMDRALAGEDGEMRRRLLDKFAPPAAKQVTFGHRAVNPAAILPAISMKRSDAEMRDRGERTARGGVSIQGLSASSGGVAPEELWEDKVTRVRKMLVDAKATMTQEAQQAAIERVALDEGAVKGAMVGMGTKAERRKAIWDAQDKDKAMKAKLEKLPPPESYGQGLLASWPLHKAGPLILEPGQSLLNMSTLNTLARAKAEHDAAADRNKTVYAKYAEVKAQKALNKRELTNALIGAAVAGTTVQLSSEAPKPIKWKAAKLVPGKNKPPTEEEKAAAAARAAEKSSIPVLTAAAAETTSFIGRRLPQRSVFDPNHEDDLRAVRDPHFAVFKGVEDPWAKTKFSYGQPTDRFDM